MQPSVNGILESALYVEDLDRSVEFYKTVLGFRDIFRSDRLCAMSVPDRQVFLVFQRGMCAEDVGGPGAVVPGSEGQGILHMAFAISSSALDAWRHWLGQNNIPVESTVKWGQGGTSLYFRDPDRHVIELATPGTWEIY